jgi:transcriptional regulator with XRE-family HTH domain
MTHDQLKSGRLVAGLTQKRAAEALGVSQPYLSQLEMGQRPVTPELARSATALYRLPATALPIPEPPPDGTVVDADRLASRLSGLGYPGFAHMRPRKANPAAVILEALLQKDLEVRLTEALPWVMLTYPELDWDWLVRQVKLQDAQNRLGFLVSVAKNIVAGRTDFQSAFEQLSSVEQRLERARLVREDTLCRESMPQAERRWLDANRSSLARHWNLLTGLTSELLSYAP